MTQKTDVHPPLFSAMLCLYRNNDADEVALAIRSAFLEQSLPPTTLIAVFDGPVPDAVVNVIDSFEDRIKIERIYFKENLGHGPARAAAIAACQDPWIAILDADDISLPHRFETLLKAISREPEVAVVGGALQEFVMQGDQQVIVNQRKYPTGQKEIETYLQSRSPIAQPTAMLRIAAMREVGNYQSWFNNEDYHLWIRLVRAGYQIRNVPEPVLLFRTSPNLYDRRGGWHYWRNEVALQWFSLQSGTTTWPKFLKGAIIRFIVQVAFPNRLRQIVYKLIARRQ